MNSTGNLDILRSNLVLIGLNPTVISTQISTYQLQLFPFIQPIPPLAHRH